MAKNFSIILFLSLILFWGSISYARPIQIGWNFSFRYYNDWNVNYRTDGIVAGYDLNPAAGAEIFFLFPILDNADIEIAVEDIAPARLRWAAAWPENTVAYLPIYLSGILNWGKIGPFNPYTGAGVNLTYMDDKISNFVYTPGMGYQFFFGACFGGGWRGEFGYAFMNSGISTSFSMNAFSGTTYFKLGYALSI